MPPKFLRETMSRHLGLERNEHGLRSALGSIAAVERAGNGEPALLNATAAAKLIAASALKRRESRGAHFRSDFPQAGDPGQRSAMTLAEADAIATQCGIEREQATWR